MAWIDDEGDLVPITSDIGGTKFNDVNADGVQGVGELGLGGWTIFIDVNGNGSANRATQL